MRKRKMRNGLIYVRAKDIVNAAAGWQIGNISGLPPMMRELVEKAISAQEDYIKANGGLEFFTDETNSMSLGSFRYTKVTSGAEAAGKKRPLLCRQAEMYLEQTGYLYRSAGAR
jgi:hypothetical protein